MLDRKFLRENRDLVTRAVADKNESVDIQRYYDLDAERRRALQEAEELQAEVNRANKAISEAKKQGEDTTEAIAAMREVAGRLKDLKGRAAELDSDVEALYLRIPNLPDADVPVGGEEDANRQVRTWGEPRRSTSRPRPTGTSAPPWGCSTPRRRPACRAAVSPCSPATWPDSSAP